ncbi:cadherin-like domain-containing protein [Neptunomonas phycophila]|uniref:cadherin-like domain-containing protein n=2 Tax=Bacteria TaxID=2 RepID=UPI0026E3C59D|nr:cadherin-like domain-containing protein [Neptunomonas phycophila]MDO6466604.1 cadherin-like domain-containing protein [Neptunomonas phycophila]
MISDRKQRLVHRAYRIERLEPRVMLSADPLGVADSALDLLVQQTDKVNNPVDVDLFVEEFAQNQHSPNNSNLTHDDFSGLLVSEADTLLASADSFLDPIDKTGSVELIVIDAGVENQTELLSQITSHNTPTAYEIVYLNADENGLEQLSSIVTNYEEISAIHLLSHGNSTGLQLGNSWVTQQTLTEQADLLAQWGASVTESADLLIYGCDLLSTDDGVAFAELFQQLSSMDLAASDDTTGASDLGGDWHLERSFGAVEAVSLQLNDDWSSTLAAPSVGLILATSDDIDDSEIDDLEEWEAGDVLSLSDPNLKFGDDSDGTLSIYFSLSNLGDGDVTISGLHYVTSYVAVGTDSSGDPVTLMPGDLLFSTADNENFDDVAVNKKDIALFRPDTPGDYTSGTTSVLLDDLTSKDLFDFALIEKTVTVAGVTLNAGDLVFNDSDDKNGEIQALTIETVGEDNTSYSNNFVLFDSGDAFSTSTAIRGIEVIQEDITLGGANFTAGQMLFSFEKNESTLLGLIPTIRATDIYALDATSSTSGTATLAFDGSDIELDDQKESPDSIALIPYYNDPVGAPTVTGNTVEGDVLSADLSTMSDDDGIAPEQVNYQWQVSTDGSTGWSDISDATESTLSLLEEYANQYVRVEVSYIDQRGQSEGPIYSDASAQIAAVNDPPAVSLTPRNPVFWEGDSPVALFADANVDLGESFDSVAAFTFSLTNVVDIGSEKLSFSGYDIILTGGTAGSIASADFSYAYNVSLVGGTATINFTASGVSGSELADALNGLTYENTSSGQTDATKVFTFESLQDSGGTSNGGTDTIAPNIVSTITQNSVNSVPTSSGPVVLNNTEEDNSLEISRADLVQNTTDPEGTLLDVRDLTISIGGGSLLDNGNGTWSYTPATDYNGPVELSYTVSDGANDISTSASFEVTAVNDKPESTVVVLSPIVEDSGARTITQEQLLVNTTDVDSAAFTASALAITSGSGNLNDNGDGTWSYTPAANDNGTIEFSYTISDGTDDIVNTASLEITPQNDAPTSTSATLAPILEDSGTYTITQDDLLVGYANDVDGDSLTASDLLIIEGNGSLVANADGTWDYTPTTNDNGTILFSYTISDGTDSVVNTASLDITPVNDAPTSTHVTLSPTNEDDSGLVFHKNELTSNASDVETTDNRDLLVENFVIDSPEWGNVYRVGNLFYFNSAENYNGLVTFSYTISDGDKTTEGTASIFVNPVNDAPVSTPATLTPIDEDSGVRVITQDDLLSGYASDVDGDSLTASDLLITEGNGSVVANADGSWNYTPAADDNGTISFSYTISDGTDSVSNTATLDITPVNDAPVSTPATLAPINEDSGVRVITQDDLLAGYASDVDGDSLTVSDLLITEGNGSLVANADGTWNYTPAADDNGTISFSYTISDGTDSVSNTATLDIIPVNDAPVSTPATLAPIDEDSGVRVITQDDLLAGYASDVDGDSLTASDLLITEGNGSLVANADGTWNYTPAADDNGTISFSYTISDGTDSVSNTATLDIIPVNDAPVSTPATLVPINEDSGVRVITQDDLLASYASDVDGDSLTASDLLITEGNGSLVANADGSWNYTPAADDNGTISFSYTISDGAASTSNTATLVVNPVNDLPVSTPLTLNPINEDSGVRIITQNELLANASDIDSVGLVVSNLAITQGEGLLVSNADGSWSFVPAENYNGRVSFSYLISDGTGSITNTASVLVIPVNDVPVGSITLVGQPVENTTVTIDDRLFDADGVTNLSYHWLRNGVSIGVIGDSYTLVDADVGQSIQVEARYIDGLGNSERFLSDELRDIANVNDLPMGSFEVAGDLVIGSVLTANSQIADEDGLGDFSYQWYRNGEMITGANQPSYTLQSSDAGQQFSVAVSYVDGFGTAELVVSANTDAITEGDSIAQPPVVTEQTEELAELVMSPVAPVEASETSAAKTEITASESADSNDEVSEEQSSNQAGADVQDPSLVPSNEGGRSSAVAAQLLTDEIEVVGQVALSELANAKINVLAVEVGKQIALSNQLQQSWAQLSDPMMLMKSEGLMQSLDTMNNQVAEQLALDKMVVGGGIAVSSGLSIGYVTWLLRSGVLLSSVLSSLPAWRFIDPLPVLSGLGATDAGAGDNTSLEDLVKETPETAAGSDDLDAQHTEGETPK